jgi:hypothetical protein
MFTFALIGLAGVRDEFFQQRQAFLAKKLVRTNGALSVTPSLVGSQNVRTLYR